jgi:ABC-type dipeptide/oligopeptide/nickel transport system permease component
MMGEKATAEVCARFNEQFGLNKPIYVQFGIYMGNLLKGDFGSSIRISRPVVLILAERLPTTIELGFIAVLIATLIGIPAGIISAVYRNSPADEASMVVANAGVSMPVYWLGLMLAYIFALLLKDTPFWLPPTGRLSAGVTSIPFYEVFEWEVATKGTFQFYLLEFLGNLFIVNSLITRDWVVLRDALKHMILPAIALSTIPLSIIARMTRSSMLEVLKQDYIRTARAKGLIERLVILKTRPAQRTDSDCHRDRAANWPFVCRRCAHGNDLRACRCGADDVRGDYRPGLSHHPGLYRGYCHRVRVHQPGRGYLLRIHRPQNKNWSDRLMTTTTAEVTPDVAIKDYRSNSLWRLTLRRIFHQRSAIIGMVILASLILIAIFAPVIAPYDPEQVLIGVEDVKKRGDPCIHLLGCPADQPQHLMGIDGNVRDEFSRVIYGTRVSLFVGITTVTFAIIIGTALGAVAGYVGGNVDNIIMRLLDVLLAFPTLQLSITIVSVLGKGLENALLAIAIVSIPVYARIVRASVLSIKEQQYVSAARALGGSHLHILLGRILPTRSHR